MIKYKIDKERQFVTAQMTGEVSYQDLIQWLFSFTTHPLYEPSFSGVLDMRPSSKLFAIHDIHDFILVVTKGSKVKGKWCCITDTPLQTAIALHYEVKNPGVHPFEVYSSEDAASSFLGVDVGRALEELETSLVDSKLTGRVVYKAEVVRNHRLIQ